MLVLTRRVDEGIIIAGNITIKVLAVEGNRVRLGITAGKEVSIMREEILEAVKKENLSAGSIDIDSLDIEKYFSKEEMNGE